MWTVVNRKAVNEEELGQMGVGLELIGKEKRMHGWKKTLEY